MTLRFREMEAQLEARFSRVPCDRWGYPLLKKPPDIPAPPVTEKSVPVTETNRKIDTLSTIEFALVTPSVSVTPDTSSAISSADLSSDSYRSGGISPLRSWPPDSSRRRNLWTCTGACSSSSPSTSGPNCDTVTAPGVIGTSDGTSSRGGIHIVQVSTTFVDSPGPSIRGGMLETTSLHIGCHGPGSST